MSDEHVLENARKMGVKGDPRSNQQLHETP